MDQYAVFGNPIAQSKSPVIHQHFAEQTGQQLEYGAQLAEISDFKSKVAAFIQSGGKGCNITAPFKELAFELSQSVSEEARIAGAVNTLIFKGDYIVGDNTDGRGLIADLKFHNVPMQGKRILLMGAGGAARGVLLPLLAENPQKLIIVNRTVEKAQQLAELIDSPVKICGVGYADLADKPFDLIINASSASLSDQLPPLKANLLNKDTICYDMVYRAANTPFNQWAIDNGVETTIDGLGMLIEQAAVSFEIWRGIRPKTSALRQLLRDQLLRAA
ncbi:shikimate dehydrogenase [Neptunicella sp. SCSIO 80796]|uniref:shikimate dehydrogenase n=1 Tax=Neptunicella plasticusilytica TaxID=3117012 RepID=UPI003A4E18D0